METILAETCLSPSRCIKQECSFPWRELKNKDVTQKKYDLLLHLQILISHIWWWVSGPVCCRFNSCWSSSFTVWNESNRLLGMLAPTLPEVLHTATDCEEETFKAVPAAQVMCSTWEPKWVRSPLLSPPRQADALTEVQVIYETGKKPIAGLNQRCRCAAQTHQVGIKIWLQWRIFYSRSVFWVSLLV